MEKDIYFESIKEEIINNEMTKRVKDYSKNRGNLKTYASIGKTLEEAVKHYDKGIIKKYAERLTKEFGRGYTQTRLKYYRRFYQVMSKSPILSVGRINLFSLLRDYLVRRKSKKVLLSNRCSRTSISQRTTY